MAKSCHGGTTAARIRVREIGKGDAMPWGMKAACSGPKGANAPCRALEAR